MNRLRITRRLLALAILVFGFGAGLLSPAPAATTAQQSASADPFFTLYFLRDGKLGAAIRPTAQLAQDISIYDATLLELVRGPRDDEHAAGLRTAITDLATLAAPVAVDAGVATVDLSPAFVQDRAGRPADDVPWRMAQVIATLTQFPEITAVRFMVAGEPLPGTTATGELTDAPLTRLDIEQLTPAILLERPGVWQQVSSPLHLTGTANVFEAVVSWRLVDRDGVDIDSGWFMATSGSGTRGTFDETLAVDAAPGRATLVLYEASAMDGAPINVVSVPIEFVAAPAADSTPTIAPGTPAATATAAAPTATVGSPTETPAAGAATLTLRLYTCPPGVDDLTAAPETCDRVIIRHSLDFTLAPADDDDAEPIADFADFDRRIDPKLRDQVYVLEDVPFGAYDFEVTRFPDDTTAVWIAPSYNVAGSIEEGYTLTLDDTESDVALDIYFIFAPPV